MWERGRVNVNVGNDLCLIHPFGTGRGGDAHWRCIFVVLPEKYNIALRCCGRAHVARLCAGAGSAMPAQCAKAVLAALKAARPRVKRRTQQQQQRARTHDPRKRGPRGRRALTPHDDSDDGDGGDSGDGGGNGADAALLGDAAAVELCRGAQGKPSPPTVQAACVGTGIGL